MGVRNISYYYMLDPVDHLAELGWHHYKKGAAEKTVHYYEQVFARRDDNSDYSYHLAATAWARLGSADKALHYLQRAVESGWSGVEDTLQAPAFTILHNRSEWPKTKHNRGEPLRTTGNVMSHKKSPPNSGLFVEIHFMQPHSKKPSGDCIEQRPKISGSRPP